MTLMTAACLCAFAFLTFWRRGLVADRSAKFQAMSNQTRIRCNGTRVRQLRIQQSMTQEKLAAMSKVNHRTIQRAEDSASLQLDTLASLAASLGVTVGELS